MVINKIVLIIILGVLEFLIDIKYYTPCWSCEGLSALLVHHLFAVWLLLGGFLFNPVYHMVVCIILLFYWKDNISEKGNDCFLTEITNRACNKEVGHPFYDILEMIGVPKPPYLVVSVLILYDICVIYYNRSCLSWNPLKR